MENVLVLGAGTWGVVVAGLLAKNGHKVTCWSRNKNLIENLNKSHEHKNLPNVKIDERVIFVNDFEKAFLDEKVIIYAIPSNAFREVAHKSMPYIKEEHILVSLAKGMEDNTLYTMSEILEDELALSNKINKNIVAVSGPTHAEEVVRNLPSMAVSASENEYASKFIQDLFMNNSFRVYTNSDIKGVEICAGFKNVIALASGILTGLGAGDNMKAALITRGLVEMIRIGEAFNCNKDTFYGLAGVGDMIVTATSNNSRNYNCGKLIGQGMNTADAIKEIGMVVESINFLPKAKAIGEKYNLDLPISYGVYEIVFNNKKANDILTLLMTRSKKAE